MLAPGLSHGPLEKNRWKGVHADIDGRHANRDRTGEKQEIQKTSYRRRPKGARDMSFFESWPWLVLGLVDLAS